MARTFIKLASAQLNFPPFFKSERNSAPGSAHGRPEECRKCDTFSHQRYGCKFRIWPENFTLTHLLIIKIRFHLQTEVLQTLPQASDDNNLLWTPQRLKAGMGILRRRFAALVLEIRLSESVKDAVTTSKTAALLVSYSLR